MTEIQLKVKRERDAARKRAKRKEVAAAAKRITEQYKQRMEPEGTESALDEAAHNAVGDARELAGELASPSMYDEKRSMREGWLLAASDRGSGSASRPGMRYFHIYCGGMVEVTVVEKKEVKTKVQELKDQNAAPYWVRNDHIIEKPDDYLCYLDEGCFKK